METVNMHLERLEQLLSEIEDLIEDGRTTHFSTKISVDKKKIYAVIDDVRPVLEDIRRDLPSEFSQARRVISDADKILIDAKNKASMILKNAESEYEKIINEHRITKDAEAKAAETREEGMRDARKLRHNAYEYADELLAEAEESMRHALEEHLKLYREIEAYYTNTVDTIYENRQQLMNMNNRN